MERSSVRAMFKGLGYKVSFVRNPFNESLVNLAFKNTEMLKPLVVADANCYSRETLTAHAAAFELANSLKGAWLGDTEQKIV